MLHPWLHVNQHRDATGLLIASHTAVHNFLLVWSRICAGTAVQAWLKTDLVAKADEHQLSAVYK
jgi:hypothetical protein